MPPVQPPPTDLDPLAPTQLYLVLAVAGALLLLLAVHMGRRSPGRESVPLTLTTHRQYTDFLATARKRHQRGHLPAAWLGPVPIPTIRVAGAPAQCNWNSVAVQDTRHLCVPVEPQDRDQQDTPDETGAEEEEKDEEWEAGWIERYYGSMDDDGRSYFATVGRVGVTLRNGS